MSEQKDKPMGSMQTVSKRRLRKRHMSVAMVGSLMAMGAACSGPNPCAVKRACGPCRPGAAMQAQGCAPRNPCAARRSCAPRGCHPCAAKRGCGPCGPMAGCGPCGPCGAGQVKASDFVRPAGYCGPATRPRQALVEEGARLWRDASIGNSGLSCQSCHMNNANLNASFAQSYPHEVAMPLQQAGVRQVHADEMVQFCMVVPMQSDALPWDSRQLAALTAYTVSLQADFEAPRGPAAGGCGPCGPMRGCGPCAPKRGCGPCAPRGCGPCAPRRCGPCAPTSRCGACGVSATGVSIPQGGMNPMPVKRAAG